MAARVEAFVATIPAGTAKAAPVAVATIFPDGRLSKVTVTVPTGPSGLMGFQVAQSGQPIIPRTANTFIVADGRIIEWDTHDYPEGGRWSIIGYNTDIYDHSLYVEYSLDELISGVPGPIVLQPIPSDLPTIGVT
jgi:hypothetical protein